jgi:hypothetical protein
MGYCSYNGQRVPGNKQNCTKPGTTWIEEDVKDKGFQGNFFIGKDFGTAVMNTLNPDSPETEEDLKGYLTRRAEDDPYGLAIDAGLSVAGGGVGGKLLSKLGLGKLLKSAFTKKKTKTIDKKPEIVNGRIVKGSKYGKTTTEVLRPRFIPGMALGYGAVQADRAGLSTPFNAPFSQEGQAAAQQRDLTNLENAIAGIDTQTSQADVEKAATEKAAAAQAKIDNMSFFDKFKLGMKDPTTAALFGAGLQDIGSNIPGQNTLAELQGDYATAAASGGPNAADFNATKVSDTVLKERFMEGSSIFKIGDSETKRKANAAEMVAMYRSVQAKLYAAGMRTDDEYVMQVLKAQAGA